MGKPTIALDFNGVLDQYTGWDRDRGISAPPRPGVQDFLLELSNNFKVVVVTALDPRDVEQWLVEHNLYGYIADVTNKKVPAVAYIDDRAICFQGDFNQTLEDLRNFQPHWRRDMV